MTVREFVHDFSAFYLRSIYLKVVILFGAFLAAATGDWTVAVATAGIPLVAALIAHLSRAPRLEPPAAARWELKVANPVPGQCPVCGLADLDERAVGDELLGDAGTALARVVPYGPDRAHAECAAVVPYAAPLRSTPGAPSQVAAKGSRTARWLAPAVESEGERLLAVLRSHGPELPPTGSRAWESWRQHGFLRHEALAWYQAGFTPWHAADLREQGFIRPRDLPVGLRRRGLGE